MSKSLKIFGVVAISAALASPAFASPRFGELISSLRVGADAPRVVTPATGVTPATSRADFFALLGRNDPRSPN